MGILNVEKGWDGLMKQNGTEETSNKFAAYEFLQHTHTNIKVKNDEPQGAPEYVYLSGERQTNNKSKFGIE